VSSKNSGNASAASAGTNPLGSYNGGTGGKAGATGSSGFGGAGGAASVVRIGSTDIVAAGGGGNGGSGQYPQTKGHVATSTYAARSDATTTNGQNGTNANDICAATSCSNNDGGGGGAGGGGAQGGAAGAVEFGAGTSNEWFGYGGSVGQNSTASISGLSASYQSYAGENSNGGSVSISYTVGAPAAPTAVTGVAGNGSVALAWTAPTNPGQSAITDYVVQYSSNGGTSWSGPVDLGSTDTTGTVSSLTNGTAYIFQVAAVNSAGTGVYSASSSAITPQGPPSAPVISLVAAQDGALRLSLIAPGSGAVVTGYDYRVDGGSWVTVNSASPSLVIPGLVNGTAYSVEVRAQSAVGAGAISAAASGTPRAVPGAPTITSLAVGNGSLSIAFTPGFSGGTAVTGYQYSFNGTDWADATGTTSPISVGGLAAGHAYSVQLRAVNIAGPGVASAPAGATTPALPGAPSVSSVTAADGSVRVDFIPGTTGGSPITGYQYQLSDGGPWTDASGATSPITIAPLQNGTTYPVSIRAVNAVGAGAVSDAIPVTPATTPSAPSIVGDTVAGSDASLTADFTAPASTGGSAITGYQYSTDAGATWRDRTDGGSTSTPVTITALSSDGTTALVNGTTYYVELRAVNGVGVGTASATAAGIATSVPSAPIVTTVIPSPRALQVTFTAPANGGAAITGYRYSTDGSTWTDTGTLGTTFTISGLRNGTDYPVRVRAVNSVGDGARSAAVSGTPVALPGRPVIDSVVRSNQTLTAAVSLGDDGGSAVTAWQYSTDNGASWATASGTSSPLTLTTLSSDGTTRLANGTGYPLQLRAVTAIGTGPASATSIVAPASAPAAASIALTAGDASVSVAFTLGVDGGSPVSRVEYTFDDGAHWTDPGTLASPFTVTGLTNGTAYALKLRADNAIGAGAWSVAASTTPRTVPGAPTGVTAISNSGSADVSWTAPASDGGSPVTGYTATAYANSTSATAIATCASAGTSCSIPTLSNGTTYYISVTATNAAGAGAASAPRAVVTPLARPGAPTVGSLTASDGMLSASFTAGTAGDRPITGYQYSTDGGSTWQTASGSTSPILIGGLTDGTAYSVALRAVSSAGVGATSNTVSGTPYGYPDAPDPDTIVVNGGNNQITVSWAAPNLNGGALLNYTATAFTGLASGSTAGTCTTTTLSCTISSGVSNGTTYYVSLQTRNTALMYSQRSAPRVPATPSQQPGAPTGASAVAGDGQATVSWTAPTSTGASAISSYTVYASVDGGAMTLVGTSSTTSKTVTGLLNGHSYTFQVHAVNGNGTGPASAASSPVTPLAPGTAPILSAPTSTETGFTVDITNPVSGAVYTATATNGATVRVSGSTATVTGLSDGAGSRVTVTATRPGYTTTTSTQDGTALLTGQKPTFSGNVATATGFGFTITNYDSTATYTITATNGATIDRSGDAVTIGNLAIGGTSVVTVQVAKAGATTVSDVDHGAAMVAGTAPTFDALASTGTGFSFRIANYDPSLTYTLGATNGAHADRAGGTVTVTGLVDGAASTVTVTATDPGVSTAYAAET
ncbi:MAG TPA: fibronectin type III domain-containing protein, partial [Pseudolysinimonas sp.]|nr:fibronectin type III domain-containing protein [Pseudolysinimonas sp.]